MKRLFGTAKAKPEPKEAVKLSDCSSKIDSRVQDLEKKIDQCNADLKRYMGTGPSKASNKSMALQVMKRKKMYEQQRDQIMGTQFNIDQLAFAQEQAEVTVMAVEAMKQGHQDLKAQYANGNLDVGEIENLMDELADFADESKEIQEAMSTAFAVPDGFDEADCEAEFAALEEEFKMEQMYGLPPTAGYASSTATPSAPMPIPEVPLPTPTTEATEGATTTS
mmetsp:Transcript_28476/g.45770  ORF Transcript_28476/g.45770 Transcript_28476/m.45770 type:complete len:222 (-) Transcript_28476:74-739(-)|eukprot:CAMPEP_0169082498 /NCGR_PEP_ID=MMETSP1015-20121227/11580_1 /TAXON_ID=342587 /ORGANISM="Karlodinium micrum, Strain CCMP2283" /LENGTH=221 /DNA_ID=CAMNT_0009142365 /DNA_START=64 /DNA_END=729 /DNA_ORIENTATION=+